MTLKKRLFVAYYRVSSKRQGVSGLGLEAQQTAVQSLVQRQDGMLIAEFTEIESGAKAQGRLGGCKTRPSRSQCSLYRHIDGIWG